MRAGPELFRAVARPLTAFFRLEAASGILLLVAAAAALAWENLGAAASYRTFVETPVALRIGPLAAATSLRGVVNEGLMTLFFFVVGMEIKHELVVGDPATVRAETLAKEQPGSDRAPHRCQIKEQDGMNDVGHYKAHGVE